MLTSIELSGLLNLLSDDTKTFETILNNFQKNSKSDQFKIGITLWYLIKENNLNIVQKIVSFIILSEIQKIEKTNVNSPFIPLFLESFETTDNDAEKKILSDILKNNINYQKMTVKAFIIENENKNNQIDLIDVSQY